MQTTRTAVCLTSAALAGVHQDPFGHGTKAMPEQPAPGHGLAALGWGRKGSDGQEASRLQGMQGDLIVLARLCSGAENPQSGPGVEPW